MAGLCLVLIGVALILTGHLVAGLIVAGAPILVTVLVGFGGR